MALDFQKRVLYLVRQATGCPVDEGKNVTPDWLMRPGRVECGQRWPLICAIYRALESDLELPEVMPSDEWRKIDGILRIPNFRPRIVEADEMQHFNWHRATTLRRYPAGLSLAFDRKIWLEHSQGEPRPKSGGWAKPKPPLFPGPGGRHRQRAFRDALADILPLVKGFCPTLRIAEFEVPWLWEHDAVSRMRVLLNRKFGNDDGIQKPKRGRPKLPEAQARTHAMPAVRVTESEFKRIVTVSRKGDLLNRKFGNDDGIQKPKRGRPKLPEGQARTCVIPLFRVTESEFKRIEYIR